ncbi:MAG: OmpA family protein [Bryobacterales bacterium]|nr:OmpA family protein [Bryobacterales bacterium]
MLNRRRQSSHENHERWLVSYADFITLLFAFFVVMFASSQTDKGRAQQVSDSVQKALQQGVTSNAIAAIARVLGGTVDNVGQGNAMMRGPGGSKKDAQEPVAELLPSVAKISKELEEEIQAGKLEVNLQARGLVISLRQAAFFSSGEDVVDAAAMPIIAKLAALMNAVSNPVRLEGHTDAIPIRNTRFPSNWDLSASRSIAMLNILISDFHVPPSRLAVVGYADTVPLDTNDTAEGRARNRRVDIVILNHVGLQPESQPGKPARKERKN